MSAGWAERLAEYYVTGVLPDGGEVSAAARPVPVCLERARATQVKAKIEAERPVDLKAVRDRQRRGSVPLEVGAHRKRPQRPATAAVAASSAPSRPKPVQAAARPRGEVRATVAAPGVDTQPTGLAASARPPAYMSGATWLDRDPSRFAYVPPTVHQYLRWQNYLGRVLEQAPALSSIVVERAPSLPSGHGLTWLRADASGAAWCVVQLPPVSHDVAVEDRILRHELAHAAMEAALFQRDGAAVYASAHAGRTAQAEAFAESWEMALRPDVDVAALIAAARRVR